MGRRRAIGQRAGTPGGVDVVEDRRHEASSNLSRRRLGVQSSSGDVGVCLGSLPIDGTVDGRAADAEHVGDLGGAVLAAVDQGDQMRLLAAVELGLLAA